jgi:[ribosomal protein S5]-alanine N-acetyltransferase
VPLPPIETERLVLRPFTLADAPEVRRLAGAREIAAGTLTIPHPYPPGAAEEWITRQLQPERVSAGHGPTFAMERRGDGALLGAVGLNVVREHDRAELGYWVGKPYWGEGYATEAARAVVRYGFEELALNRIYAFHFTNNPASGRVLQKLGMTHEGRRREHTLKWGEYLDNEAYGILRAEWERS